MRPIDADTLLKMQFNMYMGFLGELPVVRVIDINRVPTIEAEPVRHGRWVDRYGGKYANHLYECSECKGKALYNIVVNELDSELVVQVLSAACPHCGAKMDLEETR